MMLLGGLQDGFLVHHHAQVYHIEPVAPQDDARDVLADVMDVTLDRRVDDDRALRRLFSGVHVGLQNGDCILHHLGGLYHLRQEHFAGAEAFSDLLHPRHQRPLNDLYGRSEPLHRRRHHLGQPLGLTGDQRLFEGVVVILRRPLADVRI